MVKFKFRGFTSFLLFFSFLISLISGIVLYFPPQGKIAHWTHWTFWGLDKEMWAALHINSSLVFFIIVGLHLYYNWKVLFRYAKQRAVKALNLKIELLTAVAFSLFIIFATIFRIEPFQSIIRWNDQIKTYWAAQAQAQPPIPHAEDLTVMEFCEQLNIPFESFQHTAREQGWEIDHSQEKIKDLAARHGISPSAIYNHLIKPPGNRQEGRGGGWGRKSVRQICAEYNLDTAIALRRLASRGIQASEDELIKEIAAENNLRPSQVVSMITTK